MISFRRMFLLPISPRWILSRRAQRIYLVSAIACLELLATVIGMLLAMTLATPADWPDALDVVIVPLLAVGVLGTAVLLVGMWYFLLNFDEGSLMKKACWGLALWLLAPWAEVFYFFLVYRRSSRLEPSVAKVETVTQST
jgi:hypothetical protein